MKDFMLALGGPQAPKGGSKVKAPEADVELPGADGEGQVAAAQDMVDAVQSGDAEAFSAALNAFLDLR